MTAFPFRKAHFIGLAGVGMSATAVLLRDSGVADLARAGAREIRVPDALWGAEYS